MPNKETRLVTLEEIQGVKKMDKSIKIQALGDTQSEKSMEKVTAFEVTKIDPLPMTLKFLCFCPP